MHWTIVWEDAWYVRLPVRHNENVGSTEGICFSEAFWQRWSTEGDFCPFDLVAAFQAELFQGNQIGGTFHNAERFSIVVSFTAFYGMIKYIYNVLICDLFMSCTNLQNDHWTCIISLDMYRLGYCGMPNLIQVRSEDTDYMRGIARLISVFVGHTCYTISFIMLRVQMFKTFEWGDAAWKFEITVNLFIFCNCFFFFFFFHNFSEEEIFVNINPQKKFSNAL